MESIFTHFGFCYIGRRQSTIRIGLDSHPPQRWRFIHAQMAQPLVLRIRVQDVECGGVASMIPAGLSGAAAALPGITHKLAFSGIVADMHQSALLRNCGGPATVACHALAL